MSCPACHSAATFADKVQMQHRLFTELSAMFGAEVPLYDKSLLVNAVCNRTVCDLLARLYPGFAITDQQLDKTSGERHGAIRIGRPDEYRWIARFFACFAMEPHNFYDMTNVGSKSQPIIATAFRSRLAPEHRVFTSLLMTDYFDPDTRARIEALLAQRQVFSDRAKALIEQAERDGGLSWADATDLIREATTRIFKWTARARDHALYKHLCDAGFKIAADIACFERHHLNHLTPNTLCMDLYTAAMKFCLGEMPAPAFELRARRALSALAHAADRDWMHLHFKFMPVDAIERLPHHASAATPAAIDELVARTTARLGQPDLQLTKYPHSGFKDFTEGPSADTPVLLRQDAYKALTEAVEFVNADGSITKTSHTARFGEIEQRFYATTPAGRDLYDRCLTIADAAREKDPALPKRDFAAYEALYAEPFKPIPKTMPQLLERGLIYGLYTPTPAGRAAAATLNTTDLRKLVASGYVRVEGLRYEDFLPVSAAGIFASNLNQYGTKSTAAVKPTYTQSMLEDIMGKRIIDTDAQYRALEARSILDTYATLTLLDRVPPAERQQLERAAAAAPGPAAAIRAPAFAAV